MRKRSIQTGKVKIVDDWVVNIVRYKFRLRRGTDYLVSINSNGVSSVYVYNSR